MNIIYSEYSFKAILLFLYTDATKELKTSVSDGKTAIAAAVTDKGVNTAASDSFSTIAENIASLETAEIGKPAYIYSVTEYSVSSGSSGTYYIGDYYGDNGWEEEGITVSYGTSYEIDIANAKLVLSGTTGSVHFWSKNYKDPANTIVGKYIGGGSVVRYVSDCYLNANAASRFNTIRYDIQSNVIGYGLSATNKYSTAVEKNNARYYYYSTIN